MGATVSTGKAVAAFVRADGKTIFILFEKTYEKNCYPHTPAWSAVALGTFEDVMRFVFRGAACCEGGMLQTSGGHTTPENYLERWRQAFAKPQIMPDKEITLQISESFRATICKERLAEAETRLIAAGRPDIVDALGQGAVTVSLHNDIDTLIALYGVTSPFGPWRIVSIGDAQTAIDSTLVPTAVKATVVAPEVRVYKIDQFELLVSSGDTPWQASGWAYSVVGTFINQVAYPLEIRSSGSAKHLIPAFRKSVDSAKDLPPETVVTILVDTLEREDWHRRNAEAIAGAFGLIAEGKPCPPRFSVTMAQARERDQVYQITHLHPSQLSWQVPEAKVTPAFVEMAPMQQAITTAEQPPLF